MPLLKFFGDPHSRELRRHQRAVEQINALEPEMEELSDAALRARTDDFRARLGISEPDLGLGQPHSAGLVLTGDEESDRAAAEERDAREAAEREQSDALGELLPEAFATVREVGRRVLGMRHYDVQLIGGMVLHQGKIAEMRTGEGKTLVATLALYLNALLGRGAHLVTVNDYLARRDAGWNGPLFHALGLSTSVIAHEMSLFFDPEYVDDSHGDVRLRHLRPCTRREAYAADITYATNNELGFDYLRDNMAPTLEACVQRRLWYAIVDEVDSILVDEARTPLIISGQGNEPTEKYYTYARLVPRLVEDDFTIDEKTKSAALTDEGIAKIEKWTGIKNVYELEHAAEAHQINQALRAHALYMRDRDYIVQNNEIVIVDEFTGRTMPGRRWSDGLHQAIEAKEGVRVMQENVTLATITFQNFFRLYRKLAGMTGTALTEAEEFDKIYKLEVVPIPTNKPMIREDNSDLIFRTEEAKFKAVVEEIRERNEVGQPVLVGTTSIEKSERLARLLDKRGVRHEVLNAKQHEREAAIVADAGQRGAVTIATNMAGRGTDILLGDGVATAGGLYIIGTERHESRRIDNQLRGRSGRQGDPGETRFFLSFEDDVMRVFGGDRMQGVMSALRIDEDTPLESRMVSKQIEGAQSRVEGHNFDTRRHVVEYDDVMNKQREVIYGERRKILEGTDTRDNLMRFVDGMLAAEVPTFCTGRHRDGWDLEAMWARLREFAELPPFEEVDVESLGDTVEELTETLRGEFAALYEDKERQYGPELMRAAEQQVMLSIIDQRWRVYLTDMERLREGATFVAYAQKDPLIEYKQEAFAAFQDLLAAIQADIVRYLFHVQIHSQPVPPAGGQQLAPAAALAAGAGADGAGAAAAEEDEVDRAARGEAEVAASGPPAARPAAAAASGRLDRASRTPGPPNAPGGAGMPGAAAPVPPPVVAGAGGRITNVVESSAAGVRAAGAGASAPSNGSPARAAASRGRTKVGRNDPCPCGSGLKYKRCHGAATAPSG
ncbi:MAG TPA: preprotein translocase subunit SecA [Candidatus Dormibacteraeota bacterium]